MPSAIERVEAVCRRVLRSHDIAPTDRIVLAISGGPDSVGLASALITTKLGRVCLAYVNHGMQNPMARLREQRLVEHVAERIGAPLWTATIPVDAVRNLADQTGHGIEAAARTLRYGLLRQAVRDLSASVLVTAHHHDDVIETRLLRLLAGQVVTAGEPIREHQLLDDEGSDVSIVRPALEIARSELRACCQERGLSFHRDRSNKNRRYRRNWIRHDLVPILRQRIDSFDEVFAGLETELDQLRADLEGIARQTIQWRPESEGLVAEGNAFWRQPVTVRRVALRQALARMDREGRRISTRAVRELLSQDRPQRPVSGLVGGIEFQADDTAIRLRRCVVPDIYSGYLLVASGDIHLTFHLNGNRVRIERERRSGGAYAVDLIGLEQPVVIRNLRKGDRYMSDGRPIASAVASVRSDHRQLVPLIEDRCGIRAVIGEPFGGTTINASELLGAGAFSFRLTCDIYTEELGVYGQ